MTDSEKTSGQDQFKQVIEGIFQDKIYGSILNGSILTMLSDVMTFSHDIINTLEKDGKTAPVACKNGCSYCCYSHIAVTPVEALLISSFIEAHFKKREQSDLKEKIKYVHTLTQNKSIEEKFKLKEKTPCIFLENGSCSIHPVRPFICRAWNSLDSDTCKSAFHSDTVNTEIETSPAGNYVFGSARAMLVDICDQLNIQSRPMDLPHAISRCLDTADPMAHWLAGHRIFESDEALKTVDDDLAHFSPDQETAGSSESSEKPIREVDYVNYFYEKYKGRIALSVGYDQNFSEIFPFIFQDPHGAPIGIVAMGVMGNGDKRVHIYHVGSFILQKGDGSLILKELCRKADCFDIQLSVSPVFMTNGRDRSTDPTWLPHWYERFNFKGNPELLRPPRVSP